MKNFIASSIIIGLVICLLAWVVLTLHPEWIGKGRQEVIGQMQDDGNSPGKNEDKSPSTSLKNARALLVSPDGRIEWELKSSNLQLSGDQKTSVIENISAKGFKNGEVEIELSAGKVEINWSTGDVVFSGGVKAKSGEKRLDAGIVYWDSRKHHLAGENGVAFDNGRTVISSDKMHSDLNMSRIRFEGGAKMALREGLN